MDRREGRHLVTTVAVVYHSAGGRTKALAEAASRGAQSVEETTTHVLSVDAPNLLTVLSAADAIVFGCPTYMGSASGQFKSFMDSTSAIWALQGWRDKIAAAFTHSAAPSGDKLGTLTQLAVFAAQHGMIWVGLGLPPTYAGVATEIEDTNRLGSHLGAMAQSRPGAGGVPASDLRTAELLGRRVALAAQRWRRGELPGASQATVRHETSREWVFPAESRADPSPGIERANVRELAARPERFEHHLVVCASIDGVQLEVTAASEPLYFGHINGSDEYAIALTSGDDLVDRFPLRTFLSDPETSEDIGRYNHRIGDLVLHPEGYLHWPGRLRAPYEPFAFPPGMRRAGLSIVYCASQPTPSTAPRLELPPDRHEDIKAYGTLAAPMQLASLRNGAGTLAAIGTTTLTLVDQPRTIAPARGGWVVVIDAAKDSAHAAGDLYRIPEGGILDGAGIVRALVFASPTHGPDPVPPSWSTAPEPPFSPYEDGPPGALPLTAAGIVVEERSETIVSMRVGDVSADIPRYWLARMLFRVGLHGFRLGYVETYGGFFVDDRGDGPIKFGVRDGRNRHAVRLPREEALAFVERLYRAVAPNGYVERIK
jgi:NAD(P)H dehydrogenase (quinone)